MTILLLLFCCEAKTQTEYITNGSFEQIDSCYGNYSNLGQDVFEWSGCKGWSNPIYSSSDLWCYNGKAGNMEPPSLNPGYQFARTGSNFAGFYIGFAGNFYNYREYIQNRLTQTLTNGKNYEISFYVSSNAGSCNISEIGLKFYPSKLTDLSKTQLTPLTCGVNADVTNDQNNFLSDTLMWKKITLNYKANGTENFVVIGCFVDSINLKSDYTCDTTGWINVITPIDYIYIDDVSVLELPFLEPVIPNVFTPNMDGINDIWICDFSGFENVNCLICNRWGNVIYQSNKQIIQWDGRTTSGNECNDGIYFYCIETETEKYKGHIQLMR